MALILVRTSFDQLLVLLIDCTCCYSLHSPFINCINSQSIGHYFRNGASIWPMNGECGFLWHGSYCFYPLSRIFFCGTNRLRLHAYPKSSSESFHIRCKIYVISMWRFLELRVSWSDRHLSSRSYVRFIGVLKCAKSEWMFKVFINQKSFAFTCSNSKMIALFFVIWIIGHHRILFFQCFPMWCLASRACNEKR